MIIPRYYQEEALTAIYQYFLNGGKGNPLIGLPGGTGKSIIPALFIQRVMKLWPNQRFLMVTHIKELIEQNSNALLRLWPEAPLGIYSAGLASKQSAQPIIYGGIQSMIKRPTIFGHRDMAFVDEAHLVSDDETSEYQTFFALMKLINPSLKIVGMSATLFRMGMGMITQNGLFTDVVYDRTSLEGFNQLLAEGYMSPLIPLRTKTELDVSDVSIQKGEFVATSLQGAVDKAEITYKIMQECARIGQNRRSWFIFASGIEHAEHIAEQLGAFGIDCAPIHSKRPDDYNRAALKAHKNLELRAVVSYGKLTTGVDHPHVDFMPILRPLLSVPLWIQMLYRGTRPIYADGYNLETISGRLNAIAAGTKQNCLVADFARNTPRLGPINDPQIPKMKKGEQGEMPIKICESCGTYNHTKIRFCVNCGDEFSFAVKIVSKAGTDELIKAAVTEPTPIIETLAVMTAIYSKHEGRNGKPPTIRATYCTPTPYTEFVCLEHSGIAGKIARDWWRKRHKTEPPKTVDEALKFIADLRCPRYIRVHTNKKYPEVLGAEF